MIEANKAIQISENVFWVGALDKDLRNFHGYLTGRGSTYNAYLILDEKITLIDTVKAPFRDEMLARISSIVEPDKIDYIISNHSEMDHSGSLPDLLGEIKPERVFASKMGKKALKNHFGLDSEIEEVGEGLDIGANRLSFIETRMCHWPDSMVTYLHKDKVLFSQDIFGMHLATDMLYADENDQEILDYESAKYYANILMHLSSFVDKVLRKIFDLDLPLDMIAPDHGPIWREKRQIEGIIEKYTWWSSQYPTEKAVVVYDTMWGSTAHMAQEICLALNEEGINVNLMSMSDSHRSDIITELLDAGALVVGSPTMNNTILPSIGDVMTYIRGLRPRNLVAAAFGSYGWSGESPKQLHEMLEELGCSMADDPLRVHYVPDAHDVESCRRFGKRIAEAMKSLISTGESTVRSEESGELVIVEINNGDRKLEAVSGSRLFEVLEQNDIILPSICGGGACGCCRVTVDAGGSEVTLAERSHLSREQLAQGVRLACQIKCDSNIKIHVPEESIRASTFSGKIESITKLAHDVSLFRIKLIYPESIDFVPGQYVKLKVPEDVEPAQVSRPFCIASDAADKTHIDLLARLVPEGVCTRWLLGRVQVGDSLVFNGPYGDFGLSDRTCRMVWIAGGAGIAPFRSMIRQLVDSGTPRKCSLYFGVEHLQDMTLLDEFRRIESENEWFHFIPTVSEPNANWSGRTGLVTDVLEADLEPSRDLEAYISGSPGMVALAMEILAHNEVPGDWIYCNKYRHFI